jgi:diamine N-acetyltransferase
MIQGKKIFLRAMEPNDVDQLYLWENDPEIWHVSNTYIPFSRHFLSSFIANSGNDIFTDKQLRLIIMDNENHLISGTLDFFEFDPMHRRAGLGILIDEKYRNRGYATEAVELAVRYAFRFLNMHQLFVHITSDNPLSIKLFKKAGFLETGVKKEWLLVENKWKDVHFLQLINTTE